MDAGNDFSIDAQQQEQVQEQVIDTGE